MWQETRRRSDTGVEKILLVGLSFGFKERNATSFFSKTMEILEGQTIMNPGDGVWRHFIFVASARRRKDKVRCALIRRAFHHLALCTPSFRPNDQFLSIGLDVSEILDDAEMATELTLRRLGQFGSVHEPAPPSLPVLQILRAVKLCVDNGDVHKGQLILERCSTHANIHATIMQKMFTCVLQGYAEKGQPDAAKELLSTMVESSLPIR